MVEGCGRVLAVSVESAFIALLLYRFIALSLSALSSNLIRVSTRAFLGQ